LQLVAPLILHTVSPVLDSINIACNDNDENTGSQNLKHNNDDNAGSRKKHSRNLHKTPSTGSASCQNLKMKDVNGHDDNACIGIACDDDDNNENILVAEI